MTNPPIIVASAAVEALAEPLALIADRMQSPQVVDNGGMEAANMVDVTQRVAEAGFEIAAAIDRLAEAVAARGE